jgi:hypothetical protein
MKQEINKLINKFSNDNLTDYQRNNGNTKDTSRARVTNVILNALDFSIKNQHCYIATQSGKLRDMRELATDKRDRQKESDALDYICCLDTSQEEMITLETHLKATYKGITGVDFVPYKRKQVSTKDFSAQDLKATEMSDKYS